MRETGRVEIDAVIVGPGPILPGPEVARLDGVTLHFGICLKINGVQVQTMRAGQQAVDHIQVFAEFVCGAGLAGIVARSSDPTGQFTTGVFEAAHVVTLPAMERDGNFSEPDECLFRVNAESGISLLGDIIGGLDLGFRRHGSSWT
jgi:hypothetical protein